MTSDALNDLDALDWMRCIRCGHFEGAWAASDRIRRRCRESLVWDGASLDDRRVLVRCDHGLGDTIQFIRYAPLLRLVAREVIVRAPTELLELLRTADGIDRLCSRESSTLPDHDAAIEVMELAYIFRSTVTTLPRHVPYVHVAPARMRGDGLRIGVVWRSGPWDPRRTMAFDDLAPLLALERVSWHALQYEMLPGECHPRLHRADTTDAVRTARAMRGLDLVITIDSMPAHLAGALGVPVWTLLPFHADWRWMDGREDSPWYPTMRLFRQPAPGDWRSVVERVCGEIQRVTLAAPSGRGSRGSAASRTSAARS